MVTKVAHKEAIRFGKALYRLIDCSLTAPPKLGPTFLNKVNLADAYMRIWLRLKDIPLVALLVPKATTNEEKLARFHLSIPMGYVESVVFFCATTERVKDQALDTLSMQHTVLPHHLEHLADTKPPKTSAQEVTATLEANNDWEALSLHAQATALAHVELYLDDFISITQVGPTDRRQMTRYLFRAIDKIFCPNNKDNITQEDPISLKKFRKADATWSTQKVVLGWAIDTVKQVVILPDERKTNLLALLDTIPPSASRCSQRCWHKLLGIICSTVPAIAGAAGMFTRLQHALKTAKGRRINLTTAFHEELTVWRHLVASLATRPTHLREIRPHPPTRIGDTDASLIDMVGVCYSPSGDWPVWRC